jgi:hypothetical protein
LVASQIACGEENSLKIKVYGEKGGLEWHQMEPNTLLVKWPSSPGQIYRAGNSYLSDSASLILVLLRTSRGYLELLLIYIRISFDIICKIRRKEPTEQMLDFLLSKMAYVEWLFENVIASGKSDQNGLSLKFKI